MLDKILISRCFLGDNVRYDGHQIGLEHPLLTLWKQQNRLIPICPEVIGGLSVPRAPAEQNPHNGQIVTQTGVNVSKQFKQGAQQALTLCQTHQIRFALLKESSPSCGSSLIYDGSFRHQKIPGQGVTSQLLRQHGILVFSENSLEELSQYLDQQPKNQTL